MCSWPALHSREAGGHHRCTLCSRIAWHATLSSRDAVLSAERSSPKGRFSNSVRIHSKCDTSKMSLADNTDWAALSLEPFWTSPTMRREALFFIDGDEG